MRSEDSTPESIAPAGWKVRWIEWRNRLLASRAFQSWAAATPPFARVGRNRARALFDLVAGFTYSQVLLACVESNVLELLARGPADGNAIARHTGLGRDAAVRLARAAVALDIAEEVAPGWWMLGQQGAALASNPGVQAMVRHHRLLYADLADPLALLRADRSEPTALSGFWRYAQRDPETQSADHANAYSRLMDASQQMVAEQVLAAYDFGRHRALLDVGGGHGAFVAAIAEAYPDLELGVFDLPSVLQGTEARIESGALTNRVELHPGDFFHNPVPPGYDCISLVRILHDHDDRRCLDMLSSIRSALPAGGSLVIAEPMAETRGARAMGCAYFGLYLWAMGSGRPRSAREIQAMLEQTGYRGSRRIRTRQPVISSVIVAHT